MMSLYALKIDRIDKTKLTILKIRRPLQATVVSLGGNPHLTSVFGLTGSLTQAGQPASFWQPYEEITSIMMIIAASLHAGSLKLVHQELNHIFHFMRRKRTYLIKPWTK